MRSDFSLNSTRYLATQSTCSTCRHTHGTVRTVRGLLGFDFRHLLLTLVCLAFFEGGETNNNRSKIEKKLCPRGA